ncbi:uncharacterized protein LOC133318095 [Gastrolobium bilobum]|uniref:uncharacterized protein LOC133318095 n=1 Tax=Gastrolobium bilobum TaxID=150636 RepID=UPI002AB297A4|nr:uncharacterized protein LOC133318095 [Gastrolobium bilobum]
MIVASRSLLSFLLACSLQFILGFSDDSPGSKDATKTEAHTHSTRSMIVILLIVLVVFSLLSFLLFKLWRKKKREEQYARLLKLFEEDDELELELGLRD